MKIKPLNIDRDMLEEAAATFNRIDEHLSFEMTCALISAHDYLIDNYTALTLVDHQTVADNMAPPETLEQLFERTYNDYMRGIKDGERKTLKQFADLAAKVEALREPIPEMPKQALYKSYSEYLQDLGQASDEKQSALSRNAALDAVLALMEKED